MVAESVTPTLQQQRSRYSDQESPYAHHHHHHQVQHHQAQHQMNSERRSVHSPPGQSLVSIHNPHASSAMDERTAALHAAAAAAAAGFSPTGLPVGLDLSGLANLSGLTAHNGNAASNGSNSSAAAAAAAALNNQRKQREFIPDNKKDDSYWDRRRRNNEAAKRSREKRRLNDMVLEQRVLELSKENHILRAQLSAIRDKYGVTADNLISIDQVLSTLPAPDQMLSVPRPRSRLLPGLTSMGSVSPVSMSCSQRSMSPPQHSSSNSSSGNVAAGQQQLQQQQQQRRQSVLMSMGRQRSPSPASVAHHIYANENNGGRSNGFHRGYSMVDAMASSGPSAFRQDYLAHDSERPERPADKQLRHTLSVDNAGRPLPPLPALTPVPMTSPPSSLSPRKKCRSPADDSAAARTREPERSGNVVGYFDLCSSSSSSSAHCGSGSNSGDEGSHSPISSSADSGAASHRLLPHKLRHKTHLGDRDAATAAAALLTLNDIKHEPELEMETEMSLEAEDMTTSEENGCRSSSESHADERDSGLSGCEWSSLTRSSSTSSSTGGRDTSSGEPEAKKKRIRINSVYSLNDADANGQDSDGFNYTENDELRCKVARLVSEVETLKSLLGGGVRFNLS